MVKIEDPLNVTLTQADKKDLVLGKLETLLFKDLISELKQFYTITNMVCTNTQYSFNNYTPMMEIIETMLSKKDVDAEINHTQTITDFRNIMLKQFRANELSDKTARLAKTASMLDPIHMLQVDEDEIMPFVEHVVEILDEDVPSASALDTQMVGLSRTLLI